MVFKKIPRSPNHIISKINKDAPRISEEETFAIVEQTTSSSIECFLPGLLTLYNQKLISLAHVAYDIPVGNDCGLAGRAFRELAIETLRQALYTFIFKSKHWMSGRDIGPYLLLCLNRLSSNIRSDFDACKKLNVPVCPACKFHGNKEFLVYESRMLRCVNCTLLSEENRTPDDNERHMRKLFALHSRRGWRCPDCSRFISDSMVHGSYVSCPYLNCSWFGIKSELDSMAHPLGLTNEVMLSLNASIDSDSKNEWQDFVRSEEANADVKIQVKQLYSKEFEVLHEVIDVQLQRIMSDPVKYSIKKQLMYQAYSNLLELYPEEMISYLVHMKHFGEVPIQVRIFQEFIRLIENALPFNLKGVVVESLLDPGLDLFLGISEFQTVIKENGTIPNRTKENYIGKRNFGPCFIGLLIDVKDANTAKSLMNLVERYSFSQIYMKEEVPPGLLVDVTHYSIPSHFEMKGMVPLQRVRRKIVDSVYQRLHGERRKPGVFEYGGLQV